MRVRKNLHRDLSRTLQGQNLSLFIFSPLGLEFEFSAFYAEKNDKTREFSLPVNITEKRFYFCTKDDILVLFTAMQQMNILKRDRFTKQRTKINGRLTSGLFLCRLPVCATARRAGKRE